MTLSQKCGRREGVIGIVGALDCPLDFVFYGLH